MMYISDSVHYNSVVCKHIQNIKQTRVCRFCSCRLSRLASRLASLRTNSSSIMDSDTSPVKLDSFLNFSSSSVTFCCSSFNCSLLFCSLNDLCLCFNFFGRDCLEFLCVWTAEWCLIPVFEQLVSNIISVHLVPSSGFFWFAPIPRAQRVMLWQTHEAITSNTSCAITKMTMWCALYMSALKVFECA